MSITEIGDPRLQALFGASDPREAGVRPTVRLPRKGLSPIVITIAAILLALFLFSVLSARRITQSEPTYGSDTPTWPTRAWDAPPLDYIPPGRTPLNAPSPAEQQESGSRIAVGPVALPVSRPAAAQVVYMPQPRPMPESSLPPRVSAGAPLVIDFGNGPVNGAASSRAPASPIIPSGRTVARMRASALANPSTTVPQGYLIQAVLETGFNSTKPGYARAIVSRDVRGFDGRNVLIPRGSRLIGEYRSETAQGQNRAVIGWTRLIRPDGMTIALDSPAVDTLGRGGVQASVNTHFVQRLGDALLRSTVEVGIALASRAVAAPVVVVPGEAAATASRTTSSNEYVPTLSVRAGKSISIFVAHDLDFGGER